MLMENYLLFHNLHYMVIQKMEIDLALSEAEEPEKANSLYEYFMSKCKENGIEKVEKGIFGAHMDVSLINDGPNTIIMEK